jgi:hypothetical protein
MKKYKNIDEFLAAKDLTREDLISLIARSAIFLATDCAKNFEASPEITEKVVQPIMFFNEMLDVVE